MLRGRLTKNTARMKVMPSRILGRPGERVLLLGNEAIARGAVEAGLGWASAYPGTPSTEIVEALHTVARDLGIHVEWSVNEKVAFEAAYAAAMSGVRSLAAMKHVGVNVAADPVMTSAYTGVEESLVLVSADDPGMWSSQNEQDNRWYGLHAFIPVFEPYSPTEAKDLTRSVFHFSSRMKHPAILRTTTRLSHTRGPVTLGEPEPPKPTGSFEKDLKRWTVIPAHARRLRRKMLERWSRIEEEVEHFPYNKLEKHSSGLAIIASGIAYGYVADALSYLSLRDTVTVLKLATTVPPPRRMILDLLSSHSEVLVVEELEPIVEGYAKKLAHEEKLDTRIRGKDLVNRAGELTLETVTRAIALFTDRDYPWTPLQHELGVPVPQRPPTLCPGCPHRALFYALKRAVNRTRTKPIYSGDIGCYSLGVLPPFEMQDTLVEMGGSIGLANGFAHVDPEKTPVAIIGDSTFFHAGVPGLINAVYNKSPMLIVVLDNRVTAMTGHQPHPGTGFYATGEPAPMIRIEDVARGVGLEHISAVDPFNLKETEKALIDALRYVKEQGKPALVVARRACTLLIDALARRRGLTAPLYVVDQDKCTACGICYNAFSCPAIIPLKNGKAEIDPALCTGCGVCEQVCPFNAIRLARQGDPGWSKLWF